MPTFVLIGHCGADSYLLKNAISRAVPGATIVAADDDQTLEPHLNADSVLLVNRVLNTGFAEVAGVELIARLVHAPSRPRMMLVSNHEDAQRQAEAAGALPGFGKRLVNAPQTAERLRNALQTTIQT